MRWIILTLALLATPLAAAIVPKPSDLGPERKLPAADTPGVDVQLKSMDVTFQLQGTPRAAGTGAMGEFVGVNAEYTFMNHGEATSFEVGLAIGNIYEARNLVVEVDGATVESRLQNYNARPTNAGGRGIPLGDFWGYWDMQWPRGAEVRVNVSYTAELFSHGDWRYMEFNLHAANAWKGNIPHATVSLTGSLARSIDHVTELRPARNGSRVEKAIVWKFSDFAPTEDDSIFISFNRKLTWKALVDEARAEKDRYWESRTFLVRQLANAAAREGRDTMTTAELADYLNELEGLLSELEIKGDRAVMPATTAPRITGDTSGLPAEALEDVTADELRTYARRHNARYLLQFFDNALEAAEQYKTPRAKEVLQRWLVVADWFLNDALYAGDSRMTVSPNTVEAYKQELREKTQQARSLLN